MSSGLYSGVSGLAIGIGLYKGVSGLWSGASGLLADWDSPFAGASLYLNMLSGSLDSRVTFSRGTNATLTDSTGKITYAPANLLLRSQEFDDAYWTKTDTAVTANSTVAPDGTTTADKLSASATTATHVIQRVPTVTPGVRYTASVFLAAGEMTNCVFNIGNAGGGSARYAVDLQAGTGTLVSSGPQTLATATITPAGNGFYRVAITLTAFVGGNSGYFTFQVYPNTDASFTGNGTDGIFIWGAQLEPVTYQTTAGPYVATTTAAYYGPRFDYDPVTLAPRGLLIEEQRTNLVLRSEEFDNAVWGKLEVIVTANSTPAPDGTITADTLAEASGIPFVHAINQSTSFVSGTAYTISTYAKKGNGATAPDWLQLTHGSAAFGATQYANFNIATGTVGTVVGGTASIQNAGDGWYRISFTATATTTTSAPSGIIFNNNSNATGRVPTYTGSTTSDVFIWGAQLEVGAFATSYIPTVASQVTRSADVATMTGTNFSSWYNQTEGAFVVDYSRYQNVQFGVAIEVKETSSSTANRLLVGLPTTADPRFQNYMGGTAVLETGTIFGVLAANTVVKSAVAYKSGDNAATRNGASPVTSATTFATQNYTNLQIGQTNNNVYGGVAPFSINGHIRSIQYYPVRLADFQLQALTT